MRDINIFLTQASDLTDEPRRKLAAMPSLQSQAPGDKLYGRVSLRRLCELFPQARRRVASIVEDAP